MDQRDCDTFLDPDHVQTVEELAELLGWIRLQRGNPSLRDLARWSPTKRENGHQNISLSRTTLSEVLGARRFPTNSFLVSFLEALGVPGPEQARYLASWTRVAAARQANDRRIAGSLPDLPDPAATIAEPDATEPAATEPASTDTSPHRPPRQHVSPGLALAAGAVLACGLIGSGALLAGSQAPALTGTISCEPISCASEGPRLAVLGRVGGAVPVGRAAVLLIQVDSTKRWYVGSSVVPDHGVWSGQVGVGNPIPQPKDRSFLICLDLLDSAVLDRLTTTMAANAGDGIPEADLPLTRSPLACTHAIRPANS